MENLSNLPGDLLRYYLQGGAVMHMISVLSLFSVTAIIYKIIVFQKVKTNINELISKVRGSLLKGNMKGATQACEEARGPLASIIKLGLLKRDGGSPRAEIEKTMENAAIHEVAYLEKYLTVLSTVTNIAPLLGFLGTVVGMILSFEVIAEQGLNNPGMVAKGISVALLTTAYGLIVAFVTQPFYSFFVSKVAAYTREIETASNILFETFDEMERMGGAKAAPSKAASSGA
ncbi:MAG: MotA/TolQ/ExbB proton channel family protein [bacterium]|nr:MotA/TolQ/ExbB proton channel family protein [bacterium]